MASHFSPNVFMLIPTMACQAGCRYCYARKSAEDMSIETAAAAVDFIDRISCGRNIKIIFHGGEPLLPGINWYRFILPLLRDRFGRRAKIAVQSNLWMMDDDFAELFREYEVEPGTSIDGFREMCDDQRGNGYYEKTQAGAAILAKAGLYPGRICTFTSSHADDAERVFREAEKPYTIHGAIPTYGMPADSSSLDPEAYTNILLTTYHAYKADPSHTHVGLLDSMASALIHKKAGLCTFSACLGQYAAITPSGEIYSCQRFSGIPDFCLGNIMDEPDEKTILKSSAYQLLYSKTQEMREACGNCLHFPNCNGGCLYSAFTAHTSKDPFCKAYKTVFDEMLSDMAKEIAAVMQGRTLPTPVMSMADEKPHPYDTKKSREQVQKALDIGKNSGYRLDLPKYPENQLNKVFFNITRRCPLHCSHCWAGDRSAYGKELSPERLAELIAQAVDLRFRNIVITGGEPLVYPGFNRLIGLLEKLNKKGASLILRSSFALPISDEIFSSISKVFDRIIVSVDGDRASHDSRRGPGSYDRTVSNLDTFSKRFGPQKLGLWAVLEPEKRDGAEGRSVKELGRKLGIRFVQFDPLKPMGKSGKICFGECDITGDIPDGAEKLRIRSNCGLGHILHIEPDGKAYPCYTCMDDNSMLSDLSDDSLYSIRDRLFAYTRRGVDTNEKCSDCPIRYVCGGLCLAYRPHPENPDNGDFDCTARLKAIRELLIRDGFQIDHSPQEK